MQINVSPQSAVQWLKLLITREASVRFRASPCEICGGQNDTEIGFPPRTSVSPFSIIPSMLHYNFHLNTALTRRRAGEDWEYSNKAMLFHISNKHGTEEYFHFVYSLLCRYVV